MAQHDYVIDNSTGANVRADINNALLAISSTNSGSSAPSTTYAFQLFANTTTSKLQIRNAANSAFVDLIGLDGSILLADGSVSSPSLAFSDDLNTGIFSSAADTFNVATAGVERMELGATTIFNEDGADVDFRIEGDTEPNLFYVDAGNERIGIHTATPGDLVHILDNGADATIRLESTNSGGDARIKMIANSSGKSEIMLGDNDDSDTGLILYNHSDNNLSFNTAATERMRLDDTGQLLIGHSSSKTAGLLAQVNIEKVNGGNLTVKRNSANEFGPFIGFGKTRATSIGGSTIVQQNDRLGSLAWFASDGNDTASDAAVIRAEVDGTPGSDDMPGRLLFMTTSDGANGSTERLRINKTGMIMHGSSAARNTAIMAASSQHQLEGVGSNASSFSIFCNSSGTAAGAIIFAKSKGNSIGSTTVVQENDSLGHIAFEGLDGTQNRVGARITAAVDGAVSGGGAADMPGRLMFFTTQDGSGSETERLRIDSSGSVGIGTTTPSSADSADGGLSIRPNFTNGAPQMAFMRADNGNTSTAITFVNQSTGVGFIQYNNGGTSYLTSSDYRLKENVVAISDGITRLKTLKPYRFNFKADASTTVDGFFAHEVQSVVPEATSGEKDAVVTQEMIDAGEYTSDELDKEIHQGIDQSKLVPLLVAAVQELIGKVEALEAA